MAYARSRRLSAERRHHPLQRAQRGLLGQARQGTLLAVPAGRDQARGNAGAGDVPRTAGRSGPAAQPCEDPWADAQLAALRGACAVAQTGLARQLPGQKQIWFLLRLVGRECDVRLRASERPEFDAWRWNDYWIPLDSVIDFKREVYQHALTELARYLFRGQGRKPLPAEIASR